MDPRNIVRRVDWLWRQHHPLHGEGDEIGDTLVTIIERIDQVEGEASVIGNGAFIHLARNATQSIAAGGEPIDWDVAGILGLFEFATPSFPTSDIEVLVPGYYNVAVQLGWDTFEGGGTVTIIRTRDGIPQTVWPSVNDPGLWTTTNGQFFEGTAHAIPFRSGDLLTVEVDHNDASAKTLAKATLAFYLVDRLEEKQDQSQGYEAVVLADGPIGYWRLDETSGTTAVDSAGSNDGTYVASPSLNQAGLMVDGSGSPSVDFNGSTQYVSIPQAAVDGLTDLSIEAWVRGEATGRMTIFMVNWPLEEGGVDPGFNRWGLLANFGTSFEWYELNADRDSTLAPAINTTYHVVVTRGGTTLQFYINGEFDSTNSVSPNTSDAGDTVQIGVDRDSASVSGFWFNGRVDEVALYDRVLTAEEIAEHYAAGGGT